MPADGTAQYLNVPGLPLVPATLLRYAILPEVPFLYSDLCAPLIVALRPVRFQAAEGAAFFLCTVFLFFAPPSVVRKSIAYE